jgi:hypothetical protein
LSLLNSLFCLFIKGESIQPGPPIVSFEISVFRAIVGNDQASVMIFFNFSHLATAAGGPLPIIFNMSMSRNAVGVNTSYDDAFGTSGFGMVEADKSSKASFEIGGLGATPGVHASLK